MISFKYETVEDCAKFWISRDFSMIPGTLIALAFKGDDMDKFELLAGGPRESDCCSADTITRAATTEEIAAFNAGPGQFEAQITDGKVTACQSCDQPCNTHWVGAVYGYPAAHTMMFCPNDSFDEKWIRENANEIAEKTGLLIYSSDETGIVLGVDGGGYDFYEAHWIPLYLMSGREWHKPDAPSAPTPKAPKRASKRKVARKATPAKRKASRKAS